MFTIRSISLLILLIIPSVSFSEGSYYNGGGYGKNYLNGHFLLLDQTTPQTVSGGAPNFSAGLTASGSGQSSFDEGLVINEAGGNAVTDELRVEGDTDMNLIATDAANDRVGIGTTTPSVKFEVAGIIKETVDATW